MKLKFLCDAASIACPAAEEEREIASIETDSRYVETGAMFVCIRGLHTDGHTYIADAVSAGACCVLVEADAEVEPIKGVVFLKTNNTRRAVSLLYDAWYGFPTQKLKMIGVTGTNGKTSVTHMLRSILEASLCRCGLIGTVGCESVGRHLAKSSRDPTANMTTPDPAELYRCLSEMVDDRVEYVLMEVTSHALALGKLEPIHFDAAIFTNLTPEHLDFHGTMEAYADAKAALFEKSKLSVINLDSPYANRMIAHASGKVVTCAVRENADYTAEVLASSEAGMTYNVCSGSTRLRVSCPIPGSFTVMNSMQATICALELGFGATVIKDALASLTGVKGRMERVRLGLGADFTVLIDYAHTPDALENLLRTAKQMKKNGQRVVLLFGCGGDRDKSKRAVMGKIASDNADHVIVTSDNSRSEDPETIIEEILAGIDPQKPHTVIPDRTAAIWYAVRNAQRGDVILLAGKGHEEYEITHEGRSPFFEKEIVREAFASRRRPQNNTDSTETEI